MLTKLQTSSLLLGLLLTPISAVIAPQKRADICGTKGYDRGEGNYFYSESKTLCSYAACSQKCLLDSKCKSFGYSNTDCMLFNIPLSGNFDADSGSSDTYYDRGCIKSTSSSYSSGTSSKTTSSSTTTLTTTTKITVKTTVSSTSPKTTSPSTSTLTTTTKITVSSTITTTAPVTLTTNTSASKSTGSPPLTGTTTASSQSSISVSGSSTTSSSASASVTVPAGCSVPSPVAITSFTWFNSTHNLDCANPNYPLDAEVCWNSTSLCNSGDTGCICTPYCYTGLPAQAYQPLGFGPPDTINIVINGATYSGANPQSVRRWEIGEGHFDDGTGPDIIGFYGDSNNDTGSTGSLYFNDYYGTTCNGLFATWTASIPLNCSHDAGNNATCTAPVPLPLTFNGYS